VLRLEGLVHAYAQGDKKIETAAHLIVARRRAVDCSVLRAGKSTLLHCRPVQRPDGAVFIDGVCGS
jgi:hypothetical protein